MLEVEWNCYDQRYMNTKRHDTLLCRGVWLV
jgi:hypothetical protein